MATLKVLLAAAREDAENSRNLLAEAYTQIDELRAQNEALKAEYEARLENARGCYRQLGAMLRGVEKQRDEWRCVVEGARNRATVEYRRATNTSAAH